MKIVNKEIEIQTKEKFSIYDFTDKINSFVKESGVSNGLINIQSLHTTAAVLIQENEPLLWQDIKAHLEKLAPEGKDYNHDNFDRRTVNLCQDECINGHSHCKALNLPTSVTLNLVAGKARLGQWQRILFIELDVARPRKIQIQIIGE